MTTTTSRAGTEHGRSCVVVKARSDNEEYQMSLSAALKQRRRQRELSRALATAPTPESRHEIRALIARR